MSRLPDYYRTLMVDPEADPDVITAAFRVLARRLHPDRDITGVEEYRMAELNRAYTVLRDPEKRQQYDAERRLTPVGPGTDADDEAPRRGGLAARWNAAEDAKAAGPQPTTMAGHDARLDFGRYTGMTLREVAGQDIEYLRWLSRHSSGLRFRHDIDRILRDLSIEA
jgi:DnaJ-class molecular chaperone